MLQYMYKHGHLDIVLSNVPKIIVNIQFAIFFNAMQCNLVGITSQILTLVFTTTRISDLM
jgi:hypothetical protein